MNLRTYAITKHQQQAAEDAQALEQKVRAERERDIEFIVKQLNAFVDGAGVTWELTTDPELGTVTVDGIKFAARRYEGQRYVVVLGQCPMCGAKRVASTPVYSISQIGELLTDFHPNMEHQCPISEGDYALPTGSPSAEEKLVAAMYDLIAEWHGRNEGAQ